MYWLLIALILLSACEQRSGVALWMSRASSSDIDYRGLTVDARGKVKFKDDEGLDK